MAPAVKHYHTYVDTFLSQEGKTIAITGCTTGTGNILAHTCAKLGMTVLMLNRKSSRSESALASVEKEFPGRAKFVECDLMSFESVRKAGAEVRALCQKNGLDVLCNNAGIMAVEEKATGDGYDVQMQVNHFSHFLLTSEVLPVLKVAAEKRNEARIVNHSSVARKGKLLMEAHFTKGEKLGGNKASMGSGPPWIRYQQTKLACLVFTFALNAKLKEAGLSGKIKALVAHPGIAYTSLFNTSTLGMGALTRWYISKVNQSAEDGAMGIAMCCLDAKSEPNYLYGPKGSSGAAIQLPQEPEIKLAPEESQTLLWEKSVTATGAKYEF